MYYFEISIYPRLDATSTLCKIRGYVFATGMRLIKIICVGKPFAELLNETSFYSHGENKENRTIAMQLKR